MENDNSQLHYMQISVDHMDMMKYLTDEQLGIAFRQIFACFRGEKTKEEVTAEISRENYIILPIFDSIIKSIDRGRNAYEERCRTNRENGKKGGAPKGNQNARKGKTSNKLNIEEESEADTREEKKTCESSAPAERASAVTYGEIRQFQIDNHIGGGEIVDDFYDAFHESNTRFPENWQQVYTRFARADYPEQDEFVRRLKSGDYHSKWGKIDAGA